MVSYHFTGDGLSHCCCVSLLDESHLTGVVVSDGIGRAAVYDKPYIPLTNTVDKYAQAQSSDGNLNP